MAGEDFVMVQLSPDGVAVCGKGPLKSANGRRSFSFMPGVPLRVERSYEWLAVLSRVVAPDGKKMFELAPAAAASAPAPAAPSSATPTAPATPASTATAAASQETK